jgi:hypothetical protein
MNFAKNNVSCTFANEPLASEKNAGNVLISRGTTSCLQFPVFRGINVNVSPDWDGRKRRAFREGLPNHGTYSGATTGLTKLPASLSRHFSVLRMCRKPRNQNVPHFITRKVHSRSRRNQTTAGSLSRNSNSAFNPRYFPYFI